MKKRALRRALDEQRQVTAALYDQIAAAHRSLDRVDGHPERGSWTVEHRIRVYGAEVRLQPRADETGRPIEIVCAEGVRIPWSASQPEPGLFHQHTIEPREGAKR